MTEPGESDRNRTIAANEETAKAVGNVRVSIAAVVIAAALALVLFGWLLAR